MATKRKTYRSLKILAAVLFSAAFPVALKYLFQSNLSLAIILPLVLGKTSLSVMALYTKLTVKKVFSIISSVYSCLFAGVLTLVIIITPAYAYRQFFSLLTTHQVVSASVSVIFIFFIGFFSSTFSTMLIKRDPVWPFLAMGLIGSIMGTLMWGSRIFYLIPLAALIAVVCYLAYKYLDKGYRLRSIIFSLIIITISGVGGFYLYRAINPRGSKSIDALSNSMRDTVSRIFPQFNLIMELPEYGFAFDDENERNAGEAPILSPLAIFEVEANRGNLPLYLKTRVYDQYESSRWKVILPTEEAEPPDTSQIFTMAENPELTDSELRITLLLEYYKFLPFTLQTTAFHFSGEPPVVEFGDLERGFYLADSKPLVLQDTYILEQSAQTTLLTAGQLEKYQTTPFITSGRLQELAARFSTFKNPQILISEIMKYLTENYEYNVNTKALKPDADLLEVFLFEEKNGYSVHFASALVILARLNGLAARFASGFFTIIPSPDEEGSAHSSFRGFKSQVSGLSSHVWAEVYFPGRGWQTVEATPVINLENYAEIETGLLYRRNIKMNSLTRRQVNALLGKQVFVEEADRKQFSINFNPLWLLVLPGLAVIILLVLSKLHFLLYLFRKDKATLLYISRKIVRKQAKNGIAPPVDSGWLAWGESLKQRAGKSRWAELIESYVSSIVYIAYSGTTVDKQAVINTYTFYRKVGRKKWKAAKPA